MFIKILKCTETIMGEMDFSSLNPATSNALNFAARANDVTNLRRLLKKINPNCVDSRGWTCLHEAASNDSYDCLELIVQHPDIRLLVTSHEGHTALYLAARNRSSLKTIELLIRSVENAEGIDDLVDKFINKGSTEGVTPLHFACTQGRLDLIQLLIDNGADLDIYDMNGDTPMHDAAIDNQYEAIEMLLHVGAKPIIKNTFHELSAFHLACSSGSTQTVQVMIPFISDINHLTYEGNTPLISSIYGKKDEIIQILLDNGANPNIKNHSNELPLDVALEEGYERAFKKLLLITDKSVIRHDIISKACDPRNLNLRILEDLLYNIGPEFFSFTQPCDIRIDAMNIKTPEFTLNSPLNIFLRVCEYIYQRSPQKFEKYFYICLMNGMSANALHEAECPPLVYANYYIQLKCFPAVFKILLEHQCYVDYSQCKAHSGEDSSLPDAFIVTYCSVPATAICMFPYSLQCDPQIYLETAYKARMIWRIPEEVQIEMLNMIDPGCKNLRSLKYSALPLRHLCRNTIRHTLKTRNNVKSTNEFLCLLEGLGLPLVIKQYLRYL